MTSKPSPSIRILAAHRVPVTSALFESVLSERYASDLDTPEERAEAVRATHAELDQLILFDVLVEARDDQFDLAKFGQPTTDQAAYDERYLSADGTSVIATSWDGIPNIDPVRIVFFLHFVDLSQPLCSCYGDLPIPPLSPMPDHLRFLAPYAPIG